MQNEWIFDVLADLRSFAQKNGLPALASQVNVTIDVARSELAMLEILSEVSLAASSAGHRH